MLKILKILHNAIITVYMVIIYPIMALMSLLAMLIGFEAFSTLIDWHKIWVECFKDVWSINNQRRRVR